MYFLRLSLLIFSAFTFGYSLFYIFGTNFEKMSNFLIKCYLAGFIFGLIIFIVFPDSELFWLFLQQYGIDFKGDPHQYRYISTYLDPNYYSVIACIPFLLSLYLFGKSKRLPYFFISLIFVFSIFLSGSRSGLATWIALVIFIILQSLKSWRFGYLNNSNLLLNFVIFFIPIILTPIFVPFIFKVANRIGSMGNDESALARLISFKLGIDIFSENPIMGIGYNYLALITEKVNEMSSVDSSLLSLLINFGIILSFLLILLLSYFLRRLFYKTHFYRLKDKYLDKFFFQLLFYIVIVTLFSSQFNNLLFYQFWLFPLVSILSFFSFFPKSATPCQISQSMSG